MSQKKVVISKEQIEKRVASLGQQITADYAGKNPVLLCVLNGAFIFTADLCRAIDLDLKIDFIRVASYGDSMESSGTIRLVKPPELDLQEKDIILVEDIVDSGRTLAWLKEHFARQGADSVAICALIDKTERREVEVHVDYVGFHLNRGFLIGYGLDYAEQYRNLPEVFTLK